MRFYSAMAIAFGGLVRTTLCADVVGLSAELSLNAVFDKSFIRPDVPPLGAVVCRLLLVGVYFGGAVVFFWSARAIFAGQ